jgi:hypothetical protein
MLLHIIPAPLVLGPFTAPPAIIGTPLVLLLVLVLGRIVLGIAWRLVSIALVVVVVILQQLRRRG